MNKEHWAVICARRMEKTLNKKPRRKKTLAYCKTLPKRKGKVTVDPSEFITPERAKTAAVSVLVRLQDGGYTPRIYEKDKERKDRLRPRARKQKFKIEMNCRKNGRFTQMVNWERPMRQARDGDLCRQHRVTLYKAQEGHCAICGGPMEFEAVRGSLDHVIPLSIGGIDGLGNIVLTHGECNGYKSNDTPTGCEMVWLLAVNAKLGAKPIVF